MAAAGGTVHACELNPVAHGYLCRNIAENGVGERVTASCGELLCATPPGLTVIED
jgi:tRNA G37 N-methylase Trm5